MTPIRVIGIATAFGDDRIGWATLDALRQHGVLERVPHASVTLHYCSSPTHLIALLEEGARVILIDAMQSGHTPGTVKKIMLQEMQLDGGALSSHGFGVAQCLALGRALGILPAATILYGIEIEHVDAANGMSAPVRRAIPGLVNTLADDLLHLVRDATSDAWRL